MMHPRTMKEGMALQSAAMSYGAGSGNAGSTGDREREMNEDVVYEFSDQAQNGGGIGLFWSAMGLAGTRMAKQPATWRRKPSWMLYFPSYMPAN